MSVERAKIYQRAYKCIDSYEASSKFKKRNDKLDEIFQNIFFICLYFMHFIMM